MADLELIAGVVVGHLTAGIGKAAAAPVEAVAEHWKERVKQRLDRTLATAKAKAGGGDITPSDRVAFKVFTEAAFTDDEITADYLGGVLAASTPGEDAGAPIVAQIGRLSATQLRLHYVVYRELRRLWPDPALNLYQETEATGAGVRIPIEDAVAAVAWDPDRESLGALIGTLAKEGLLNGRFEFGPESVDGETSWSLRVRPSALGAELFLWGHGVVPVVANRLFDRSLQLTFLEQVSATPGTTLLTPPRPVDSPP